MSGFVRRLERAWMKRAGYTRERWIMVRKPTGGYDIVNVRRGGEITDPDDNPIGRSWPVRIPARAMPAHTAWFEARAKARGDA